MTEENKEEKLTFWQKLKQLTGVITAITGLIAVLGGSGFFFWNQNDHQDKVQETAYNFLTKRVEELTLDVRVMQKSIENLERINQILLTRMGASHPGHHLEKIDEIKPEEPEMITIITESMDNPDAPPKIEYEGAARLPNFKNIQEVVSDVDAALDAAD